MKSEQQIRERLEMVKSGKYGDGTEAHIRADTLRWVLGITIDNSPTDDPEECPDCGREVHLLSSGLCPFCNLKTD